MCWPLSTYGSLTDSEEKMLQTDRNSTALSLCAGLQESFTASSVSSLTSPRSLSAALLGLALFVSVKLFETCGFACFKDCFVVVLAAAS